MRSLACLLLMVGLTACAAPPQTPEASITRKASTKTSAVPDPFASAGHSHPVDEEADVTYAATLGDAPLFIHGRYAARRVGTAVVLTMDFHHEKYASALLRFNDVSNAGFKKDDLQSGGFQINGAHGEAWGLTIEKDRAAFMKALTLTTSGNTIKGSFKGEVRPFYGGAEGSFPIEIEFETPFPTE